MLLNDDRIDCLATLMLTIYRDDAFEFLSSVNSDFYTQLVLRFLDF